MHTTWAFLLVLLGLSTSSMAQDAITIIHPPAAVRIAKVRTAAILGSLDGESAAAIQLRVPCRRSIWLKAASRADKESFAPAVKNMFPPTFVIHRAVFSTVEEKTRQESSKEYLFDIDADIDLPRFWSSPEFREMYETLYRQRLLTVRLEIEGWTQQEMRASEGDNHLAMAGVFVFFTDLDPGMNVFTLRALDENGGVLQKQDARIFYANDYTGAPPDAPDDRVLFHEAVFDDQCAGCHDVEIPESAAEGGESVEQQCAACHSSFQTQTSSHFPVQSWDCMSCHDAASTPAFQLRSDKSFDTQACFACHVGIEEAVTASAHIHFPATDRCMACHDAHSSPDPSLLVDKEYTICASCHEESATTPHPVVGHPVKRVQKPSQETAELSCTSCHNPHGSAEEKLLVTSRRELCKQCHNF